MLGGIRNGIEKKTEGVNLLLSKTLVHPQSCVMCTVVISHRRERRIKRLRVGVLPSEENLKRLPLFILYRRKLRGNMTEAGKIREAVNKVIGELLLPKSLQYQKQGVLDETRQELA